MRLPVVSVAAVCGIAAIVLVTSATKQRDHEDRALRRHEAARLRAHFDSVLAELNARQVSNLGPAQRTARAELVRLLTGYRDAGVFPHNHDFPGEHVPYFRDEHGTLCAMAYLIASTGGGDIVDAIAERRNNAYIPELATDARLSAWLDSVGLTVAEAARIQPTYDGRGPSMTAVEDRQLARYVLPSLALGVPALFTTVLNWRAPRETKADATLFVGALSGAAATLLGVAILADEPNTEMRIAGLADVTVGSASLVAALRRSLRHARAGAPRPPIAATESRFTIDVVPARHRGRISPAARVQIRF
jgi:hypothetical protein